MLIGRKVGGSLTELGHDLGLRIIAEGVEDEPTLTRLALLGCDLAQGFHVSRPMPPQAFDDWMGRPEALLAAATAVDLAPAIAPAAPNRRRAPSEKSGLALGH